MGKKLDIDIYTDILLILFAYKCGANQIEFITEKEYIQDIKIFQM